MTLQEKIKHAEEQIPILVQDGRLVEARKLIDEIRFGLSKTLDSWRRLLAPPIARVVHKSDDTVTFLEEGENSHAD